MNEPTQQQVAAAQRLGVSLHIANGPLTVAQLVELVDNLQRRVAELETQQQRAPWSLRR